MFWKLSKSIAYFLSPEESEEDLEVYSYGLWLMMKTLFGILEVLILGILLHSFIQSVIYLTVLLILRTRTGGFHATTSVGCNMMTVGCYLVNLLLSKGWVYFCNRSLSGISIALIIVLIAYKAPVEHENKPLSDAEKERHWKVSVGLSVGILILVMSCYECYEAQMAYLTVTMLMVAGMMLLELLLQRERRRGHEEH